MIPALRHRSFALLFGAAAVSSVGSWMQIVGRSWVVYRDTGNDPRWLGFVGAAFAAPMVLVTPLGGVVADRRDRVQVLAAAQLVGAIVALSLAALAFASALRPIHLVIATFVASMALAFENPARQALVPELVPREALSSALSLNAATFTGAALIGPSIGALLLHRFGEGILFLVNGASFAAVLAVLPAIGRRAPSAPRGSLAEAWAFVLRSPRVRALLALAAFAALTARAYVHVLADFAKSALRADERAYGALLSSSGLGALATAIVLSIRRRPPRGFEVYVAAVALAIAPPVLALCSRAGVACAVSALAGAAAAAFTTLLATELQSELPSELRGRITSLWVVTLIGLPGLGALLLSTLAAHASIRFALVVAGAAFLPAALGSLRGIPRRSGRARTASSEGSAFAPGPACPSSSSPEPRAESAQRSPAGSRATARA